MIDSVKVLFSSTQYIRYRLGSVQYCLWLLVALHGNLECTLSGWCVSIAYRSSLLHTMVLNMLLWLHLFLSRLSLLPHVKFTGAAGFEVILTSPLTLHRPSCLCILKFPSKVIPVLRSAHTISQQLPCEFSAHHEDRIHRLHFTILLP